MAGHIEGQKKAETSFSLSKKRGSETETAANPGKLSMAAQEKEQMLIPPMSIQSIS